MSEHAPLGRQARATVTYVFRSTDTSATHTVRVLFPQQSDGVFEDSPKLARPQRYILFLRDAAQLPKTAAPPTDAVKRFYIGPGDAWPASDSARLAPALTSKPPSPSKR